MTATMKPKPVLTRAQRWLLLALYEVSWAMFVATVLCALLGGFADVVIALISMGGAAACVFVTGEIRAWVRGQ